MSNPEIEYDQKNESVRVELLKFIKDRGIKQSWVAGKCNLSSCSISLYLNKRRMLTDMHLDIIKNLMTK